MSPKDDKPRLDGAQLVAVLLETLLNGAFWILLVHTFQALWFRAVIRGESFFRPMAITAMVLFVTITSRWIVDIATAFQAFIPSETLEYCINAGQLNPAEATYLALSNPKSILGSALYVTTTVIGDAFMVYRLYIVWGRNRWIIIPPSILCVALAVAGGMVTYLFNLSRLHANTPIFATAGSWITSCFVLTFACNLYSTVLIAFRIFWTNRKFRGALEGTGLSKILEILVESAALYSCCVIIALISYVQESNVQFVMVAMNNPVIGIIFCMIVTRAHAASSQPDTAGRSGPITSSHAMRPVAIKITTQSQNDAEGGKFGPSNDLSPPTSPRYQTRRSDFPYYHPSTA